MTAPATTGVLEHRAENGSWAWAGLRVAPARALHAHRGYGDVPEEQRRAQAVGAELAWLAGLCRPGAASRFELRCTNEPATGLLRCVLLGQTVSGAPADAPAAALELRHRLGQLPPHVVGREILDPEQLRAELLGVGEPADRVELVELRKRLTAHPLGRTDTDRSHAVLGAALAGPGADWEPFWARLAARPVRTLLSVALEPVLLHPAELAELDGYAREYRRLATPGQTAGVWRLTRPGDPAAQAAAEQLTAVLRAAAQPGYRLRVTLASEPAGEAAGTAMGGPGSGLVELAHLLAGLVGGPGAALAVLPVPPADRAAALANLTGLNLAPLPLSYPQGLPPGHYGWVEETLSGLGTVGEAAALLRLPYQVLSHRPLFDDRFLAAPPADAPPAAAPPPATDVPQF
ncbi:hypothetical protein [Kitasatospora sp. LaBMicrA B282]|uniref:hypothetical protein n=1 Tax=Kitasatospora sp. LaBMicrA B282 TaxID=3420949 RepID=UPI003D120B84